MKPLIKSKTFWFNALTGISVFLALPELQEVLGADALKYIVIAQSAINVVLRIVTNTAVSLIGK